MDFRNKVVFITGAGSGIGKAAAIAFAQVGARVGCLGHTGDELKETVDEIRKNGGEAIALLADITRPDEMQYAVDQLQAQWGGCDVVFANAGINGVWAPIEELDPEEWNRTIATNLTGTYLTIRSAVPLLKKHGGAIVITSSINGTRVFSNSGATAYSCTKAAQVAMAKMLAVELARWKIRVNVVCPGAIDTEIRENTDKQDVEAIKIPVVYPEGSIPLTKGKPGRAEDVARLVLFLAGEEAAHITGTEVWVDGAQSLLMG